MLLFCDALGVASSEEREDERTLKGVGRKRAWRIDWMAALGDLVDIWSRGSSRRYLRVCKM